MTLEQRINELEVKHGGLRAAAKALDIDAGYLCRLRDGIKTNPSQTTLKKLGLKRVVVVKFVKIRQRRTAV